VLGVFKQNTVSTAIALVFVTFIMKNNAILHPPTLKDLGDFHKGVFFQWDWMYAWYKSSPNVYVFMSSCVILGVALYINYVINREKMFQRKSYLTALMFVLMTSMLPSLNVLSFAAIANIFIFMAVAKALTLQNATSSRKAVFDIGLWVSMAVLFYFPAILFLLALFIFILVFRPIILQEIMAYLLGLLTPIYFSLALLFLSGKWPVYAKNLYLHINLPLQLVTLPVFILMTVSSISLLIYGIYIGNNLSAKNPIAVKKKWGAIHVYIVFGLIAGCFSSIFPSTPWIIAITPFSILLCNTFHNNIEKYNIFTFYFLLAVLITVQWLF